MKTLIGAILAFLFLHRVVSAGSLRPAMVRALGERRFMILFSIASAGCLTWLWLGYREAALTSLLQLYTPGIWLRVVQIPLQFTAVVMIVLGLTTRSPTVAGLGRTARNPNVVRGALRITRHPFLWGVCLFSAGHVTVLPTLAALGFFGTLLLLALTGTFSIDAKRRRSLGMAWEPFASATSNLPLGAVLTGRQRIMLSEIGWWRMLIATAIFTLTLIAHPLLFG